LLFAGQSGRIGNCGADVSGLELGIGSNYLVAARPFGQRIQNHGSGARVPFAQSCPLATSRRETRYFLQSITVCAS